METDQVVIGDPIIRNAIYCKVWSYSFDDKYLPGLLV